MREWLEIGSMPTDGTKVLGWSSAKQYGGIAVINSYEKGGMPSVVHDAEGYYWSEYRPTHWMPLPSPPKQEALRDESLK